MRRIFGALALLALALCSVAWGQQDVFITGTNAYTVLGRGLPWGNGSGAVNNNFVFSALNPNTQVCLYVTNNNPSNSHAFTVTLWQAGDPQVKSFANQTSKWASSSTVQTFPQTVLASSTKGIFFNVTAAAQLTAQFTGTAAAGGSPDTADIFAVETTSGGCGITSGTPIPVQGAVVQGTSVTAANQFPVPIGGYATPGSPSTVQGFVVGGFGNGFLIDANGCCASSLGNGFWGASNAVVPRGIKGAGQSAEMLMNVCPVSTFGTVSAVKVLCGYAKNSILEMATDISSITGGNMPGWTIQGRVVNPGANTLILADYLTNSSTVSSAYKNVTLSCSAACELQLIPITSAGTTCTAVTPQNLNVYGSTRASYNAQHIALQGTCVAQPATTGAPMWDVQLGANVPYVIDLTGLVNERNVTALAGWGVFSVSAVTGTVIATATVVEE
jgi:hypothetical protein